MSLRDSWKKTGVGLGHAFRDLGKTVADTVKVDVDREQWKQTGVGLGHAFRDFGKTTIASVAAGAEKLDDLVNDDKE